MIYTNILIIILILPLLLFSGCSASNKESGAEVIKKYSLDTLDELIVSKNVELDKVATSDGNGSLKITAEKQKVVTLFETGDVDVENARLIYRARLKSNTLAGKAYLEFWCSFSGKGEYFSRGLNSAISGTSDWVELETSFFLKKGENPDNIKLNLVINGKGTVWIDEIELIKSSLDQENT